MQIYYTKRVVFLIVLIELIPLVTFSQFVFNRKTDIPVAKGGSATLRFPWTGGFNNPQFSAADLNNDDIKDLVVFDRDGNKTVTFSNHGAADSIDYEYAPEYEYAFKNFHEWMLLDDFNCDNIPDVFTNDIFSVAYYMGKYTLDNYLEFDSVASFGFVDSTSGIASVFVSPGNIPAITDINNDGDIDILSIRFENVEYYENQSQELTGTCGDTIVFSLMNTCWGSLSLAQNNYGAALNSCSICFSPMEGNPYSPEYTKHEVGYQRGHFEIATLLAYDEDSDGDKEVIIGKPYYENINRLINCGTKDTACMCDQDSTFPSYDKPLNLPLYPASFHVDVNNDGLRDLLVAPNETLSPENYKCIWHYENVGTADSVVFNFMSDTFLISQTLDFGQSAYPVFFDYNSDGLLDLVVGNSGYNTGFVALSKLALLQNAGTATSPSFQLVTLDFAGASTLELKALYPAFGDMDGDGDQDMIVGELYGFLHYFRNDGASFALALEAMFDIDVGFNSAPFIYDVNGDSHPDLLVGEKDGTINYFENTGTRQNFVFSIFPDNHFFGEVNVSNPGPNGYSTPIISNLDSSGQLYLLSGSEVGSVKVYEFDSDSIYTGSFIKKFDSYSGMDEGMRTSITIADLNDDGLMEMVMGNNRGGLSFFSQSEIYSGIKYYKHGTAMTLFPNPVSDNLIIELREREPADVRIFNLLGQLELSSEATSQRTSLDVSRLTTGIHILEVRTDKTIDQQLFFKL